MFFFSWSFDLLFQTWNKKNAKVFLEILEIVSNIVSLFREVMNKTWSNDT